MIDCKGKASTFLRGFLVGCFLFLAIDRSIDSMCFNLVLDETISAKNSKDDCDKLIVFQQCHVKGDRPVSRSLNYAIKGVTVNGRIAIKINLYILSQRTTDF